MIIHLIETDRHAIIGLKKEAIRKFNEMGRFSAHCGARRRKRLLLPGFRMGKK
jgi:hypothetical protein